MASGSERFSEREKHLTKRSRVDAKAAESAIDERKSENRKVLFLESTRLGKRDERKNVRY